MIGGERKSALEWRALVERLRESLNVFSELTG
jgi:hypothetical protein